MSSKSTTDLSSTERIERRAQWEAFEFRVPAEGRVLVTNTSYGEEEADDHRYVVTVANGRASACTCPSDKYQPGACKHRRTVENTEAVMLAASTSRDGEGR